MASFGSILKGGASLQSIAVQREPVRPGFARILKMNPYHDLEGNFTDKAHAVNPHTASSIMDDVISQPTKDADGANGNSYDVKHAPFGGSSTIKIGKVKFNNATHEWEAEDLKGKHLGSSKYFNEAKKLNAADYANNLNTAIEAQAAAKAKAPAAVTPAAPSTSPTFASTSEIYKALNPGATSAGVTTLYHNGTLVGSVHQNLEPGKEWMHTAKDASGNHLATTDDPSVAKQAVAFAYAKKLKEGATPAPAPTPAPKPAPAPVATGPAPTPTVTGPKVYTATEVHDAITMHGPKEGVYTAKHKGEAIGTIYKTPYGSWKGDHFKTGPVASAYGYGKMSTVKKILAVKHAAYLNELEANKPATNKDVENAKAKVKELFPGSWLNKKGTVTQNPDGSETHSFAHAFYDINVGTAAADKVKEIYSGVKGAKVTHVKSQVKVEITTGGSAPVTAIKTPVSDLKKVMEATPAQQNALEKGKIAVKATADTGSQEQYKAELAEAYPKLVKESMNQAAKGFYSDSQSKLNQIEHYKQKLAAAGMGNAEITALVDGHEKAFKSYVQGEQSKAQELSNEYQVAKAKYNFNTAENGPAFQAKKKAYLDFTQADPGIHKPKADEYFTNAQKHLEMKKMDALLDMSEALHGDEENDKLYASQSELKAKQLGASPVELKAAKLAHLGAQHKAHQDPLGAKAELLLAGMNYYQQKTAAGGYPDDQKKVDLFVAKDHFDSAQKHYEALTGNTALMADTKESSYHAGAYTKNSKFHQEMQSLGKAAHEQATASLVAAQTKHSKNVEAKADTYYAALYKNGENHLDTYEAKLALDAAKKEAFEDKEYPLSQYQSSVISIKANAKAQQDFKSQMEAAKMTVENAIYAAEFKQSHFGIDHPETQAALVHQENVIEQNKHLLTPESLSEIRKGAVDQAIKSKEIKGKILGLGPQISKRVLDYDLNAATFKYPENPEYGYQTDHGISLTPAQKGAVLSYVGSGYSGLNANLAMWDNGDKSSLHPKYKEFADNLDKAIAKTTLESNVRLTRNMSGKHFFDQFGLNSTKVDQGTAESVEGKVYREPAFSSTSMVDTDYMVAEPIGGRVKLNIRAAKGMQGLRYGGGEKEVILPRGMTYVVRKVYKTEKHGQLVFHVDVDAIAQTGKTLPK